MKRGIDMGAIKVKFNMVNGRKITVDNIHLDFISLIYILDQTNEFVVFDDIGIKKNQIESVKLVKKYD